MRVIAVCTGKPEVLAGKRYRTGINKHAVDGELLIDETGLAGDAVCDSKHHGGPDQAVYVEGDVSLEKWRAELAMPVEPGLFGENLVIGALDNEDIAIGDRLVIGDLVLEATAPRMPCATFAAKMNDPSIVKRYKQAERPGFYCRVIRPGSVAAGRLVALQPIAGPRITMPQVMRDYGKKISGDRLDAYLSVPVHARLQTALKNGKVKF